MNINEEYQKRIDIILAKQENRKNKNKFLNEKEEIKIKDYQNKILEYTNQKKKLISENESYNNQYENNKKIIRKISIIHNIDIVESNHNNELFLKELEFNKIKLELCNEIEVLNNKLLTINNKREKEFKDKNFEIIDNLDFYKNKINEIKKLIAVEIEMKLELRKNIDSISNKFKLRNTNLKNLEKNQELLIIQRKENKKLNKKINDKEIELRKLHSEYEFVNRNNLKYLNQFIEETRKKIRNEPQYEHKKIILMK